MYLVDTNVVSEARRGTRAAVAWLKSVNPSDVHLSVITLGEIMRGIAVEWGRIGALRPRGDADGLIAATAIVHDYMLVTRNVGDFEDTRATVINPWDLP